MNVRYTGANRYDPRDSLANRALQRTAANRKGRTVMIIRTVGELIKELEKLPSSTIPISLEPPFDGIKLVPQGNGKVLFSSPPCEARAHKSIARTG